MCADTRHIGDRSPHTQHSQNNNDLTAELIENGVPSMHDSANYSRFVMLMHQATLRELAKEHD